MLKLVMEAGKWVVSHQLSPADEPTYVPEFAVVVHLDSIELAMSMYSEFVKKEEFARVYAYDRENNHRTLIVGDQFDDAPMPADWNVTTKLMEVTMDVTMSCCAPIDVDECCDLIRGKVEQLRDHNAMLLSNNKVLIKQNLGLMKSRDAIANRLKLTKGYLENAYRI